MKTKAKILVILLGTLLVWGMLANFAITNPEWMLWGLAFGVAPGILLIIAATVFFYLFYFTLGWLSFGFWRPLAGSMAGLALVIAIAIGVPWNADLQADALVASVAAHDRLPTIKPTLSEIVEIRRSLHGAYASDSRCDDLCARLLLNGNANAVLVSTMSDAVSSGRTEISNGGRKVFVRRKVASACNVAITDFPQHWIFEDDENAQNIISSVAKERALGGECIEDGTAENAKPDYVIEVEDFENTEAGVITGLRSLIRLPLRPQIRSRTNLSVWKNTKSGMTLIGSVTALRIAHLISPLYAFDSRMQVGWGAKIRADSEATLLLRLASIVDFDVRVPDRIDPTSLRQTVERLLRSDTKVFGKEDHALLNLYLKSVSIAGGGDNGLELVGRIILDDRVTALPELAGLARRIGHRVDVLQAMMFKRLMSQSSRDKSYHIFEDMDHAIAALPVVEGRNISPLESQFLATPELSGRSPALVFRLSAWTHESVPLLLSTITTAAEQAKIGKGDYRSETAAVSALAAICRMGRQVDEVLPALDKVARAPETQNLFPEELWIETQLRLGRRPGSVWPRSINVSLTAEWEKRMVERARRGNCKDS